MTVKVSSNRAKPNSSIYRWVFHEIDLPAIEVPTWLWKPSYAEFGGFNHPLLSTPYLSQWLNRQFWRLPSDVVGDDRHWCWSVPTTESKRDRFRQMYVSQNQQLVKNTLNCISIYFRMCPHLLMCVSTVLYICLILIFVHHMFAQMLLSIVVPVIAYILSSIWHKFHRKNHSSRCFKICSHTWHTFPCLPAIGEATENIWWSKFSQLAVGGPQPHLPR